MPAKGSEIVDIDVALIRETELAWLVSPDGDKKVWVPKSVSELERVGSSNMWTLTLPRNIAEEKELV